MGQRKDENTHSSAISRRALGCGGPTTGALFEALGEISAMTISNQEKSVLRELFGRYTAGSTSYRRRRSPHSPMSVSSRNAPISDNPVEERGERPVIIPSPSHMRVRCAGFALRLLQY